MPHLVPLVLSAPLSARLSRLHLLVIGLGMVLALASCNEKTIDPNELTVYTGPMVTAKNIVTHYTDSALTRVVMKAPLQYEYSNGDREFPQGLHIDFHNEKGVFSSTLDSRYARYDRLNDIYLAKGEVVINDVIEHKKLETEELKWNRSTKRVFTDKFVRITTPKEMLTGMGLEAAQDFSWYRIVKPDGKAKAESDIL